MAAIDAPGRVSPCATRDLPCLGFTHLQPAQPTTVGKRAALWCYDLVLDLEEIEHRLARLKFRGVKGTTGTQASFLALFDGDHAKVEALDRRVAEKMGFAESYPRHRPDLFPQGRCAGARPRWRASASRPTRRGPTCASCKAAKRSTSRSRRSRSAPPRWPTSETRCARNACARLARFAISLAANAEQTAATQWLERTLDDSANRRLPLPQAFLAIDAVLILYRNIVDGLVVHPKVIEKNLRDELPFMATEEILMAGVRAGGDRQALHERIRVHSQEVGPPREGRRRAERPDRPSASPTRPSRPSIFTALSTPANSSAAPPSKSTPSFEKSINPIRAKYPSDLTRPTETVHV